MKTEKKNLKIRKMLKKKRIKKIKKYIYTCFFGLCLIGKAAAQSNDNVVCVKSIEENSEKPSWGGGNFIEKAAVKKPAEYYKEYTIFNQNFDIKEEIDNQKRLREDINSLKENENRYDEVKSNEQIYEEYLRIYAQYFHYDAEKVIKFARKLTKNFTIPFEEVNNTTAYNLESKEAACMVFCHQIYRNDFAFKLEDKGIDEAYFETGEERELLNDSLVLSSGYTFSEFLGKVCYLIDVDETYTMSICKHESGHFSSDASKTLNNFAGLRKHNKERDYFEYETPEAGIIALCRNLKRYQYMKDITSLETLSGKYVNGDVAIPDFNWVHNVKSFHTEITNNYSDYFLDDYELEEDSNCNLALKR